MHLSSEREGLHACVCPQALLLGWVALEAMEMRMHVPTADHVYTQGDTSRSYARLRVARRADEPFEADAVFAFTAFAFWALVAAFRGFCTAFFGAAAFMCDDFCEPLPVTFFAMYPVARRAHCRVRRLPTSMRSFRETHPSD